MVGNGSNVVNALRAEQTGCLAVRAPKLLGDTPMLRDVGITATALSVLKTADAKPKTLRKVPEDVLANVFVHLREADAKKVDGETGRCGRVATATVPLAELPKVAEDEKVTYIEPGESLKDPVPLVLGTESTAPGTALRKVEEEGLHHDGKGVLVGIIDVQGFDFSHPDFLDSAGKTRFVRIWDQGGSARPSPEAYGYGAEFFDTQLNAAIAAASAVGAPAYEIERQSQIATGSHGTHVASIAAGNLGVARNAKLAGVLISLPEEDEERRKSFYDSTRIAHAVDYLLRVGEELGLPVSINVSLGTNGGAHDGSAAISRWIDAALATPGRAVCVAAGNAGQERALHAGDFGYVMGRIHSSGQIPAKGLTRDLELNVVGNGILDLSENELEVWYPAQDRFEVSLRPPGGAWIGPVGPGEFVENQQLPDGSMVSIYNEPYHPANGANILAVYLSPLLTKSGVVGIPAGTWTVRLRGAEVRDGNFHCWIERDDPRPLGPVGDREAWSFPSFFSETSNVDDSSISSLGCGRYVIAVANHDEAADQVNISSSEGPTRDGRTKPDVAAPGTEILAANGFSDESEAWVTMTGTSMASPFVCGVVALMLATEPKLTAAQIEAIIRRTAKPLPGTTYAWRKDSGFGVLDPKVCVLEASQIFNRKDKTV